MTATHASAAYRLSVIDGIVTAWELTADSTEPAAVVAAALSLPETDLRDLLADLGAEQPSLPLLDAAHARVRQAAAVDALNPFAQMRRARAAL